MRDSLIVTRYCPARTIRGVEYTGRIVARDLVTRKTHTIITEDNTYAAHSEAAVTLAQIQRWFATADTDRWRRLAGARTGDFGYGWLLVLSRDVIVTAAEYDARQSAPRGL